MKKSFFISLILTALSGLSKILSNKLTSTIGGIASKISGSLPTKPSSKIDIPGWVMYGINWLWYKIRSGAAVVLTAPLNALNTLIGFLGKLFIPLLIITIVLLALMILFAFLKKRKIQKKNEELVESAAEKTANRVQDKLSAGSNSGVFSRLRGR